MNGTAGGWLIFFGIGVAACAFQKWRAGDWPRRSSGALIRERESLITEKNRGASMTVEERIEQVEREMTRAMKSLLFQVRLILGVGALVVLSCLTLAIVRYTTVAVVPKDGSVIRAKIITIVDDQGRERIQLQADGPSGPGLFLFDGNGNPTASLVTKGSGSRLDLSDLDDGLGAVLEIGVPESPATDNNISELNPSSGEPSLIFYSNSSPVGGTVEYPVSTSTPKKGDDKPALSPTSGQTPGAGFMGADGKWHPF